jgi:hypothetical protein
MQSGLARRRPCPELSEQAEIVPATNLIAVVSDHRFTAEIDHRLTRATVAASD